MTDTPSDGREAATPGDDAPSREQLEAEIVRLRARVAELEAAGQRAPRDVGGTGVAGGGVSFHQLFALFANAPNYIYVKDVNHRYVFVSKQFAGKARPSVDDFIGLTEADTFAPAMAAELLAIEAEIMATGKPFEREEKVGTAAWSRWVHSYKFPMYDAEGRCTGIGGFVTDISDRRRLDEERLALQEQVIATQQALLRELSTPLLPLSDGVLAMPLIGTIDSVRAGEILETLLQGISERHVHTAILDITGVREVGAQTADALVGAARAARLLGARVILTGVSPAVARTLVLLDANLDGIAILSTLASGIAAALPR
jgi:anti-anti-sigma regulatory factor/PAS domain-containing protein